MKVADPARSLDGSVVEMTVADEDIVAEAGNVRHDLRLLCVQDKARDTRECALFEDGANARPEGPVGRRARWPMALAGHTVHGLDAGRRTRRGDQSSIYRAPGRCCD